SSPTSMATRPNGTASSSTGPAATAGGGRLAEFSYLVAFTAGLLSFLSPCVLPLVPSYIGFLTGLSLDEMKSRRRIAFTHAVLFVLGFTLVFMLLGATATALGRTLVVHKVWLQRIGRSEEHTSELQSREN